MAPGEVRVLAYVPSEPVIQPTGAAGVPDPLSAVATRIAIEALAPSVPDGNLRGEAAGGRTGDGQLPTSLPMATKCSPPNFSGAPMTKRAGTASRCTRS